MNLMILDFKWSYGLERLTDIFRNYFIGKGHQVNLLGAVQSQLSYCAKLTHSKKTLTIIVDCLNPLLITRILLQIRKFNPHVIYINSSHPINAIIVILSRLLLKNILIVSHIHDPEPYYNKPLMSKLMVVYQKLQLKYSHHVVCYGNKIKEYIQKYYKIPYERTFVIRHGAYPPRDCKQNVNGSNSNYKYFTMIGQMGIYLQRKGIPVFLEAAKILNEQNKSKDVEFVLAGNGDLSLCKASISNLPNLTVANRFITNEGINHYMRQSYAFVMPYTGGVLASGFVAISYYNRCPVIVSSIGCLPEYVTDNETGFIVPPGDADKLAEAMEKMLNVELRNKMAENCWRYYKTNLQWDSILPTLEAKLEHSR